MGIVEIFFFWDKTKSNHREQQGTYMKKTVKMEAIIITFTYMLQKYLNEKQFSIVIKMMLSNKVDGKASLNNFAQVFP